MGALIHADVLRARLPESVHSLHVLVDGSMFVDVPDVEGQRSQAKLFTAFYHLHSVKGACYLSVFLLVRKDFLTQDRLPG